MKTTARPCATDRCKTTVTGKMKYCKKCLADRKRTASKDHKKRMRQMWVEEAPVITKRQPYQDDEPPIPMAVIRQWRSDDAAMSERRQSLNQEMLAQRLLRRSVVSVIA